MVENLGGLLFKSILAEKHCGGLAALYSQSAKIKIAVAWTKPQQTGQEPPNLPKILLYSS